MNKCLGDVAILVGFASDGDARPFCNQFAAMKNSRKLPAEERFTIEHPSFTYAAQYMLAVMDVATGAWRRVDRAIDTDKSKWVRVGVRRLHSQDPIHCTKLLDKPQDSVRVLAAGKNQDSSATNITKVYNSPAQTPLTRNSVLRQDRQNFGDCQIRSSIATCDALREIGEVGTALFYEMQRRYVMIFLGQRITMYERVVNASYVIHFMRLQRLFVKYFHATNLTSNSWTYQTYLHVQLSCHSAILLIKATREFSPSVDFGGELTGSDCVESLFRMLAGFGKISAGSRDASLAEMLVTEGRNATLKLAQAGKDGVVVRKRSKVEYQPQHVEDMERDVCSKKCGDMDDAKILRGLEEGIKKACADWATLGVVPGGDIPAAEFAAPWLLEKDDMKMMRKAEVREDGEWQDIEGGVDALTAHM